MAEQMEFLIAHEIGTVRPGARADLLLVDGDPRSDLNSLRRVRRVFQDGRTVVIDGRLL